MLYVNDSDKAFYVVKKISTIYPKMPSHEYVERLQKLEINFNNNEYQTYLKRKLY